jgi:hypothetical protein
MVILDAAAATESEATRKTPIRGEHFAFCSGFQMPADRNDAACTVARLRNAVLVPAVPPRVMQGNLG